MKSLRLPSCTFIAGFIALTISLAALAQNPRKPVAKPQPTPVAAPSPTPQSAIKTPQSNTLPLRRVILYSNGAS